MNWLVFANEEICDHVGAFRDLGFISWIERVRMELGDVVYVFMSDTHRIRYRAVVEEVHVQREDTAYWRADMRAEVAKHMTFRLRMERDYGKHGGLPQTQMQNTGEFAGGRVLLTPNRLEKKPRLLALIRRTCP